MLVPPTDLDALIHKLILHFKAILGNSQHVWYRIALTDGSSNNFANATIFDDLSQVGGFILE